MTAALPPRPRVAAVVLAAGSSTRMGAVNKLLADIDGVPMLRRVVAMLRDPRLAERIVVTGAEADAVRAVLAGLDVRFSHNAAYDEGIASSIRTGVAALPPDVDGALIVLGDMPRVAAADVALLLDAFDPDAGRSICVPVRAGRRGNPVLWAARCTSCSSLVIQSVTFASASASGRGSSAGGISPRFSRLRTSTHSSAAGRWTKSAASVSSRRSCSALSGP